VSARLLYRKVNQYLLNFLFGEKAGLTMPVSEMAHAEATIHLRPTSTRRIGVGPPTAPSVAPAAVSPRTAFLRVP
jgi:hypothetical protein